MFQAPAQNLHQALQTTFQTDGLEDKNKTKQNTNKHALLKIDKQTQSEGGKSGSLTSWGGSGSWRELTRQSRSYLLVFHCGIGSDRRWLLRLWNKEQFTFKNQNLGRGFQNENRSMVTTGWTDMDTVPGGERPVSGIKHQCVPNRRHLTGDIVAKKERLLASMPCSQTEITWSQWLKQWTVLCWPCRVWCSVGRSDKGAKTRDMKKKNEIQFFPSKTCIVNKFWHFCSHL